MAQRGRAPLRGSAVGQQPNSSTTTTRLGPAQQQCVSMDANPNDNLVFSLDDIRQVIREVAKKPKVTALSLQGSFIPGRSMALLANYLSTNRSIRSLNLSQCSLGDDTALILLKALILQPGGRLSGLQSVDLSFNYLTDKFCAHVKTHCTQISLRRLNIGFNPLTLRGLSSLLGVGSVLTTVDARYCTLIPPSPHTVDVLKSHLSTRPNLRHLCLDGLGFRKHDFQEMRKHLEGRGLQDIVEVGMGRAAGPMPTVARVLIETYKQLNGDQDPPGFEDRKQEEGLDNKAGEESKKTREGELEGDTSATKKDTPEGNGQLSSPATQRRADAAIVAEIAKVDGSIVVVREKVSISAYEQRSRPRSLSRSMQVKEVEPVGLVSVNNANGSRSASASSYYSAQRSRSAANETIDLSVISSNRHHDPLSSLSSLKTRARSHSCTAPPTVSRRGERKKEDKEAKPEQDEEEEKNKEGEEEEDPSLYIAPHQPAVIVRSRSRSAAGGSSRAPSMVGSHHQTRSRSVTSYARGSEAGAAGGGGGEDSAIKTQLRRGKLARMFLDKCSADDSQAVQILNLYPSTEALEAGQGFDVDCPQELVDVSGVPSYLEKLPLYNQQRILGLAKLLFFIIYSPGERLPLPTMLEFQELPPSVRHLPSTEQAKYRSSRSVENATVRRELMSILGGDVSGGGEGGTSVAAAEGAGGDSATSLPPSHSDSARLSRTSSTRSGVSTAINSRYLNEYLKGKRAKHHQDDADGAKPSTARAMSQVSLAPRRK